MILSDAASAVAPWVALLAALGTTAGTIVAFTSPHRANARLRADIKADLDLLSSLEPASGAAYDMNEVVTAEVTEFANRIAYRRLGLLALLARLGGVGVIAGVLYVVGAFFLPSAQEVEDRVLATGALPSLVAVLGFAMVSLGLLLLVTAGAAAAFFWLHSRVPEAQDVFEGQLLRLRKDREHRRALGKGRTERLQKKAEREEGHGGTS